MDIIKLCLKCLFATEKEENINLQPPNQQQSHGHALGEGVLNHPQSHGQEPPSKQHHSNLNHSQNNSTHNHQLPSIVSSTLSKQFTSIQDIPANITKLVGTATFVIDGDTFQFYHQPNGEQIPKSIQELKQKTLKVRIAGIDAPETDHGTEKGMPFGNESKEFLSRMILKQQVELEILDKDQYGRLVCMVHFNQLNVGVQILRNGFGHMYTGRGAQYGNYEKEYKQALNGARQGRIGLWSQENVQKPSEFKRNKR